MNKNLVKVFTITSILFGLAGIACFIVKLVESTMRTAHDWAQTYVVLGFVFLAVALLILCAMVVIDNLIQKKQGNKAEVSDEELLAKYKSKSTK